MAQFECVKLTVNEFAANRLLTIGVPIWYQDRPLESLEVFVLGRKVGCRMGFR